MSQNEDVNIRVAIVQQTTEPKFSRLCANAILRLPQIDNSFLTPGSFRVVIAICFFPASPSCGFNGFRPSHLRDLTSSKEARPSLVASLTALTAISIVGKRLPSESPMFFNGRLIARQKLGGIRHIAIGK
jgi:hypothetical protein